MRNLISVVALCLAGCATKSQWEKYHRDYAAWEKDDQISHETWQGATGGGFPGGLPPKSAPQRPGWFQTDDPE